MPSHLATSGRCLSIPGLMGKWEPLWVSEQEHDRGRLGWEHSQESLRQLSAKLVAVHGSARPHGLAV